MPTLQAPFQPKATLSLAVACPVAAQPSADFDCLLHCPTYLGVNCPFVDAYWATLIFSPVNDGC